MDKDINNQNPQRDEHFLRLLMGNQDNIYAFILSLVHNRNDADDILQDTIVVMWRKYDTFKPGTSFVRWGVVIAKNLVLKFFEKNRYSKLSFSSDIEKRITSITVNKLENSNDDKIDALRDCIKKLNPNSYELIKNRYLDKVPIKKIASERGIALHTMYRTMGKIHKMLMRCVQRTVAMQGVL